ncbi:hypothetical protein TRAPUB_12046 [Trametes pubescens]|uniref:Uncharacterized protein n=1 Tax=Trametes pubescens TaxID=154538 RepID=A0A1M2VV03_TRAPU|nr:hypothetical protein TRAPUB_12046 [Trametes pubescens]
MSSLLFARYYNVLYLLICRFYPHLSFLGRHILRQTSSHERESRAPGPAAPSSIRTSAEATAADTPRDPYSPDNWHAYLGVRELPRRKSRSGNSCECADTKHGLPRTPISLLGDPGSFPAITSPSSCRARTLSPWTISASYLAKFHGAEVLKILPDADREHALTKLEEARVRAAGVKGESKAEVREQEERARGVKLAEREQAKR